MADNSQAKNPFESNLEPLSDEEMARVERSRVDMFEVAPLSDEEVARARKPPAQSFEMEPAPAEVLARVDRNAADRRERQRAEVVVRRSNRQLGALLLLPAAGLVVASIALHNPDYPWQSTISSTTALAIRIGGLMLGLQGLRMLVFGERD